MRTPPTEGWFEGSDEAEEAAAGAGSPETTGPGFDRGDGGTAAVRTA